MYFVAVAYQAVYEFVAQKGEWPKVNDAADAQTCLGYATQYMDKIGGFGMGLEVKESLVTMVPSTLALSLVEHVAFSLDFKLCWSRAAGHDCILGWYCIPRVGQSDWQVHTNPAIPEYFDGSCAT